MERVETTRGSMDRCIEDDRKSRIFKTESSSANKKFQGISELMDWRHVATPFDEDFDEFFILIVQNGAACLGDVALRINIFSQFFHNFLETSVLNLLLIIPGHSSPQ